MKIAHWAPFAPGRCGLYEAARDCARADDLREHEVLFIDTGVAVKHGEKQPGQVGVSDTRGGWTLTTSDPSAAYDADLWVCHDGVSDRHSARVQIPMVWMVHGRPSACFRPEQAGLPTQPYSIIAELASWPRVKALVTMWDEHVPYWRMLAGDKLRSTVDPPLDRSRFTPDGPRYEWVPKGEPIPGALGDRRSTGPGDYNLLLCDSWREDIDIFEAAVACHGAALRLRRDGVDVRIHFWAVEPDRQGPWQHVWKAMGAEGFLGEIHPRMLDFDHVYRSADLLVTSHSIAVRTISEALSCGLPVVAGERCRYTPYTGTRASTIVEAHYETHSSFDPVRASAIFDLSRYGQRIEHIYQEAVA